MNYASEKVGSNFVNNNYLYHSMVQAKKVELLYISNKGLIYFNMR